MKEFKINLQVCKLEYYFKRSQKFFGLLETAGHVLILQEYEKTNQYSLLEVESDYESEVIPVPLFLDIVGAVGEDTTEDKDDYHQVLVDFLNSHGISFWIRDGYDLASWDGQIITDYDDFLTKTLFERDRMDWLKEGIVSKEIIADNDFLRILHWSRGTDIPAFATLDEQKKAVDNYVNNGIKELVRFLKRE